MLFLLFLIIEGQTADIAKHLFVGAEYPGDYAHEEYSEYGQRYRTKNVYTSNFLDIVNEFHLFSFVRFRTWRFDTYFSASTFFGSFLISLPTRCR